MRYRRITAVGMVVISLFLQTAFSFADETDWESSDEAVASVDIPSIKFRYEEFPPYTYSRDGKVTGKNVDITNMIASVAGVRIEWQSDRYMSLIRGLAVSVRESQYCITGYHYREGWENSWQYTMPIAKTPKLGVAFLKGRANTFNSYSSLIDLINDPARFGGFATAENYGDVLGTILKSKQLHLWPVKGTSSKLLKVLASGRVNYVLIDGAHVAYANEVGLHKTQFDIVYPTDPREPIPLYIICSKGVSDTMIQRLNSAIQSLGLPRD